MRRFLERIFDVSRYTGLVERDRARMVYAISALALVGAASFMMITSVAPEAVFGDNLINPGLFPVLFGIFYIGVIGAIVGALTLHPSTLRIADTQLIQPAADRRRAKGASLARLGDAGIDITAWQEK